jgi:ferrous iron transport protein A
VGILSVIGLTSGVCEPEVKGRILNSDHKGRISRLLMFKRPGGARQVSVLSELRVGESGELMALDLPESVQNHLMHLGFVPGALVTALRKAPAGDPTVYGVDGMEIALRHETADSMRVHGPAEKALLASEPNVPEPAVSEPEVPEFVEATR